MKTKPQIDEILEQEKRDTEAGKRYRKTSTQEPLSASVARRLRLILQCLILRPCPDHYDEWSVFRRQKDEWVAVWPGQDGYEKAESHVGYIYYRVLSENPWSKLIEKRNFPEQMGATHK